MNDLFLGAYKPFSLHFPPICFVVVVCHCQYGASDRLNGGSGDVVSDSAVSVVDCADDGRSHWSDDIETSVHWSDRCAGQLWSGDQ